MCRCSGRMGVESILGTLRKGRLPVEGPIQGECDIVRHKRLTTPTAQNHISLPSPM